MIPSRQIWKNWSPMEKISYGAQFAASLALLPTVLFAYLAWKEARLAREDQTEFFLAEKAPRLEIKNIYINSGILKVDIHNSGESLARDVSVSNIVSVVGGSAGSFTFDKLSKEIYGEEQPWKIAIAKNQTISFPLETTLEIKNRIGFIPWDLQVSDSKGTDLALDGTAPLIVNVTYHDVRDGKYIVIGHALMKPLNYQTQLKKFLNERIEAEGL